MRSLRFTMKEPALGGTKCQIQAVNIKTKKVIPEHLKLA